MENDKADADSGAPEKSGNADKNDAGPKDIPEPRRPRLGRAGWRLALICLGIVLVLCALGFAALSLRTCSAQMAQAFRTRTETKVYEYGYSLSREGKIILASKSSGFVIPRDFAKKLILGFSSTAKIQIACQALVNFYVDAEDLGAAEYAWEGSDLVLRLAKPRAMRPIIETSSIRQAILDRGFAFNERAELESLLSQLSDLVAASPDAVPDDSALESCRQSMETMVMDSLAGMRKRIKNLRVEWK